MSADPSALKLFSDDIENREEEQDIESIEVTDKVEVFFENQKAIEWIKRGSFQRVALQLPDSLLKYAYEVATDIEEKSGAKIYILADTSYRNCCVDVIAAEHSNCDALIHYGEACLSEKTDKIPVLYIFCRLPVDFRDFKVKFDQYLEKNRTESTKTIVLLYDSVYSHTSEQLKKVLEKRNLNIIECKTVGEVVEDEDVHLGRRIDKNIQEEESLLVFVGQRESALLPIWLMTFPKYNKIVWYQPKEKVLEKEM